MPADPPSPQDRPPGTLKKIGLEVLDVADWLAKILDDERTLESICYDLGLDAGQIRKNIDLDLPGVRHFVELKEEDAGLDDWYALLTDVVGLVKGIGALLDDADLDPQMTHEDAVQTLLDLLASHYVRSRWFKLSLWMEVLRFSTEPMTLYGSQGTAGNRFLSSLRAMVKFALGPFTALYSDAPLQTEEDARQWSERTFLLLAGALAIIGHSVNEIGFDIDPDALVPTGRQSRLRQLIGEFKPFKPLYGQDLPDEVLTPEQHEFPLADRITARMFSLQVQELPDLPPNFDGDTNKLPPPLLARRLSLAWVPEAHGGKGLYVHVGGGGGHIRHQINDTWTLRAALGTDAGYGVLLGGPRGWPHIISVSAGDVLSRLSADLALAQEPLPDGQRRRLLSLGRGNSLDIGHIVLSGRFVHDNDDREHNDARAQIVLHDCRLTLDSGAFDGFIGSILPSRQHGIDFTFGIGCSTRDGFYTVGDLPLPGATGSTPTGPAPSSALRAPHVARSATASPSDSTATDARPPDTPVLSTGLTGRDTALEFPIGRSIGPVRLQKLQLNLVRDTGPTPQAQLQMALSLDAKIGPVRATIDRIGLKLHLAIPSEGTPANLHFADLDIGFLSPARIGIVVDAGGVKGGGFLGCDPARHQYTGILELTLSDRIALKAIGLLATRLPDGRRGYSLLLIITAQSAGPGGALLHLPMGWRLTGLGGLIGLHRTLNADAVRAGLQGRVLESILFPPDPVANAPTVLATLDRIFPVQQDSHLFGLMVQLQWGTPTLIEASLALLIELGRRLRFIALGSVCAILPERDHDLLRLQLDAVGIIDADQGTLEIDARLVDSRLLQRFPLTGSGALRARWNASRSFVLAVGGLHHGFQPPAGFPPLERLNLSLTTGDNPRLSCDAYFALTSNTVQFGAHAHLYAAAGGFSITGDFGFDVLIQLLPFSFLAEFFASMQLKRGTTNLFAVRVEGALEGPRPLAIRARCTFEILWWDISVRVNCTLVEGGAPPLPVAVDALARLRTALGDLRSWSTELPPGQTPMVSLRDTVSTDDMLHVHPLGTLKVQQNVVPLDLSRDIDRFHGAPVSGDRRFRVSHVRLDQSATDIPTRPVQDDFAPAQFFEMSDTDKLALPSFESMNAGLSIGSPAIDAPWDLGLPSRIEYQTDIIDRQHVPSASLAPLHAPIHLEMLERLALNGAAGRSPLRRLQQPAPARSRVRLTPARFATLDPEPASTVNADAGSGHRPTTTYTEAQAAARLQRGRLIVNQFELAQLREPA